MKQDYWVMSNVYDFIGKISVLSWRKYQVAHRIILYIVTIKCNDIMFFLLSLHGSYSYRSVPFVSILLVTVFIFSARSSYTIISLTPHISSPHGNINGDCLAPAGNYMDNIFGRHL